MLKKIVNLWIPIFIWAGVIFVFSSIPNLQIKQLGIWDFVLRKIAHITEYAILSILVYRAVKNIFWSIYSSIIYAVTDEYHQYFVPGRITSLFDVLVDSLGVILGIIIYIKIKKGQ